MITTQQIDREALDRKDFLCREPEQDLIEYLIGPSDLAIDVGANTGSYTKTISDTGAVCIAVECNPSLCNVLRERFSSSPNVKVKARALSSSGGFAFLRIPTMMGAEQDGHSSLQIDFDEADSVRHVLVRKQRLDSLTNKHVSLIKIDVEGHELEVLKGAQRTIERCRPFLLIECEDRHRANAIQSISRFLQKLDYRGYFYLNGKLIRIEEFDLSLQDPSKIVVGAARSQFLYINNFLFIHKEAAHHAQLSKLLQTG